MRVNQTLRRALATSTALALAVVAGQASALGLGQIQVKSRPGQPLLAEIPIVSSDPTELQGLQVQLASPDTFRRIGLEPPQGDVSALHFEPALDERGRPVIRITSPAPVQQPLLTFLVEVDWGGGRLVREYSALVETPRTVAAPAQPPVEAPVVSAPNVVAPAAAPIAAEPTPVPAPTPATPPPSAPTPAPAAAPEPVAAPAPAPAPVHPTPAPAPETHVAKAAPAPKAESKPTASQAPAGSYHVRTGDTLAGIAGQLGGGQADSLDQAMLAVLRANPEAFVDGNINRLKAGAVLRTPTADELSRISTSEAAALVHEQIAGWRQGRKPVAQPVATATPVAGAKPAPAHAAAAATARRDDARLEIVPPAPGRARQAGTRSGLEAGGEGEMLRQQLQETKETLVARDAEVAELKARVADLEKIQKDQQQLIQMKDSALASAQQNLAKANNAAPAPTRPVAQAQQAHAQQAHAQPAPPPESSHAAGPWLWSGIGLVLLAIAGWWFTRRREPATPPPSRFKTDTFTANTPAAGVPVADEPTVADFIAAARREPAPPKASVESPRPAVPAPAPTSARPSWMAGAGSQPSASRPSPSQPSAPVQADLVDDAEPRSAAEQLDLAQAYLDVGDEEAARTLLREIMDGRDPAAREAAARLLREL